jgi:SAM-dependent methyltransferase
MVVAADVDVRGLPTGGVGASAEALPFRSASFDIVTAFDVIEHCRDDQRAVAEAMRVLRPGGRLLVSVPAYRWAWTDLDVHGGHHRRYRKSQVVQLIENEGFVIDRASYMFFGTFPFFAADRLRTRWQESRRRSDTPSRHDGVAALPEVSPFVEKLLTTVSQVDARLLPRVDLPFGSSVICASSNPKG